MKKPPRDAQKSLGTLEWADMSVHQVNAARGEVVLRFATRRRRVDVASALKHTAYQLVKMARTITSAQRDHAQKQLAIYEELKSLTGYTPPQGER